MKVSSLKLKRTFTTAMLMLLIALMTITVATFAWFIYDTNAHTTELHMAAGSSSGLEISNEYDGTYGSSAMLKEFTGVLTPVSTNNIDNGFQEATSFIDGTINGKQTKLANAFSKVKNQEYYHTSLYLKSDQRQDLYLAKIGFEDADETKPISTAIRMGFVVHKQGFGAEKENPEGAVFEINKEANKGNQEYNTQKGHSGQVLDSTKTDGSTVDFTPYSPENYCSYNETTGIVSLNADSLKLGTVGPTPVEVEIYIWLEGCDPDCTVNLSGAVLKNIALQFASK